MTVNPCWCRAIILLSGEWPFKPTCLNSPSVIIANFRFGIKGEKNKFPEAKKGETENSLLLPVTLGKSTKSSQVRGWNKGSFGSLTTDKSNKAYILHIISLTGLCSPETFIYLYVFIC